MLIFTHIVSKIKLQQCIHLFRLPVCLGMETRREIQVRPHESRISIAYYHVRYSPIHHHVLEQLRPKVPRESRISIAYYDVRDLEAKVREFFNIFLNCP